jgi:hypothetical protein
MQRNRSDFNMSEMRETLRELSSEARKRVWQDHPEQEFMCPDGTIKYTYEGPIKLGSKAKKIRTDINSQASNSPIAPPKQQKRPLGDATNTPNQANTFPRQLNIEEASDNENDPPAYTANAFQRD